MVAVTLSPKELGVGEIRHRKQVWCVGLCPNDLKHTHGVFIALV